MLPESWEKATQLLMITCLEWGERTKIGREGERGAEGPESRWFGRKERGERSRGGERVKIGRVRGVWGGRGEGREERREGR